MTKGGDMHGEGGMRGKGEGCMVKGGMHGRGHAWQGTCMAGGMHGRGHAWQWGIFGTCILTKGYVLGFILNFRRRGMFHVSLRRSSK